jgi:L-lactate dehydrogenase
MAVRFDKVAIIGTGHVGATAAYAMMLRGLFTQILLIDADGPRAQAEALDIADANALARPAHVLRGDYRDAGDAAIVVITAGATTHGEESRLSVAGRSAAIVADCARRVVEAGFGGVMIVASNPVDAMAQVAQRASGLPVGQVIGTGTLLDSARFRRRLADRLGVAPVSVEGQVLGEHGDSEVAVFSGVRIGGLHWTSFAAARCWTGRNWRMRRCGRAMRSTMARAIQAMAWRRRSCGCARRCGATSRWCCRCRPWPMANAAWRASI